MDESWHGSDILLLRDTHIPGGVFGHQRGGGAGMEECQGWAP